LLLQVVNGPEVLSKYVGQAEENIRNLFGEAEAEYKEKGDASVSLNTVWHGSFNATLPCVTVYVAWHNVA
jgi:hypothetical protein